MSSAMVSAAAAQGRLFFSTADATPDVRSFPDNQEHTGRLARFFQSKINNQQSTILANVTSASHLTVRPAPEMLSSGIAAINALTGGWPRGCLTEICGPASSGRTTLLLAALAAATRRGEFCVLVDASDALDPHAAADAGVDLDRLLWIRCGEDAPQISHKPGCPISRAPFAREACPEPVARVGMREAGGASQDGFDFDRPGSKKNGLKETGLKKTTLKENRFKEIASPHADHRLEQALHATDLLLESGGFGLVVLDLSDLSPQQARRIPLTTWFRFRRAVENTSTVLLAIEQHPIAGSCSSLQLQLASPAEANPDEIAAERHKNAAHGASRGSEAEKHEAPQGRKKLYAAAQTAPDFPYCAHAQLLTGLEITAELMRSRLDRKPARSTAAFASKTAWTG
jgi:recombination protein RecA